MRAGASRPGAICIPADRAPARRQLSFQDLSWTAFGVQYVMIYARSRRCYVLERVLVKRAVDGTSRRSAAGARLLVI